MEKLKSGSYWNPYISGILAGVVIVLSVWITGKYAGASTSFVRTAGMIESVFSPERVKQVEYFVKESPKIEWQWMFVFGIFVGSLIASLSSKTFRLQAVPSLWESRFGSSLLPRAMAAFGGGALAMYGARLADG